MLIFFLIVHTTSAQDNFEEGYMLTVTGDTISGWINYDPAKIKSGKLEFKKDLGGEVVSFVADSIIGFGSLPQDRYFNSVDVNHSDQIEKQVFAEQLFRGRANLYFYNEAYYLEKDNSIEILEQEKMRESNQQGGRFVYSHKTYIGTLNRYFSDCLPDRLLRGDVAYTEKDFVDIFRKYSECSKTPFHRYRKVRLTSRRPIRFHILAGINSSKITFAKDDLNKFGADKNFFIGAGATLPMSFLGGNVFLTVEPIFNKNRYEGKITGLSPTGVAEKNYIIEMSVLKVPVGVKVDFSKKAFTPYARGGLSALFTLKGTWAIEYQGTREHEFDINQKNASLAYWGALGFQKRIPEGKGLFVEFRLEKIGDYIGFYGPSGASYLPSNVTNKMVVFGFNF